MGYRRTSSRRSYSRGRAAPARARSGSSRRGGSSRRSQSGGTIRLVIEQAPASGVSRFPGVAQRVNPPARKAKF